MRTALIAFNKRFTRSKAIDLIATGVADLPLGHIAIKETVGVQRHLTPTGNSTRSKRNSGSPWG